MIISSFRFFSLSCKGRTRTTTLMLSPGEVGDVDPCDRVVMLSMLPLLRSRRRREGRKLEWHKITFGTVEKWNCYNSVWRCESGTINPIVGHQGTSFLIHRIITETVDRERAINSEESKSEKVVVAQPFIKESQGNRLAIIPFFYAQIKF